MDDLIKQFGVTPIKDGLIERIEKLSGRPPHHFLRRGIFCGHRDLNLILDDIEAGKKVYLYTGRGPSSESLHLGHLIPLEFTRYLQEVFDLPLIIQLTDDEKFLRNPDKSLEQIEEFTVENIKDLIAIGFNPARTFIFRDTQQIGRMYPNILKMQRKINLSDIRALFGLDDTNCIGHYAFPVNQAVPAVSDTFPELFGGPGKFRCLVPCAIDQDVYFRMTRDLCHKLKRPKPSVIHSGFLPDIRGPKAEQILLGAISEKEKDNVSIQELAKMSSTSKFGVNPTVIFLNYNRKKIGKIINKYGFSGGQDTEENHRKYGGNPDVDMSLKYLRFFLESDEKLEEIIIKFKSGEMLTSQVKRILVDTLATILGSIQKRRAEVTDELIAQFTNYRSLF